MNTTEQRRLALTLATKTSAALGAGRAPTPCLKDLFHGLAHLRGVVSRDDWAALCRDVFLPHPLSEVLLADPLTRRALEKPRGYAGDAIMMDMIYSEGEFGPGWMKATGLGSAIHRFILSRPTSEGVRGRRRVIAGHIEALTRDRHNVEVLSVACGHLREARLVSASAARNIRRLTAFDQDEESLREVSRSLPGWAIEEVPGSIRRLIVGGEDLGSYDLIYSLGLYDYLAQPAAERLTASLFKLLKPGGRLGLFLAQGEVAPLFSTRAELEGYLTGRDFVDVRIEDRDDVYRIVTAEKVMT